MRGALKHGHHLMRFVAPFASFAALPVVRSAGRQYLAEYPNTFYAYALEIDLPPRPALDRHVPNAGTIALTGATGTSIRTCAW